MTEAQLDEIESHVGFALPAEYRRVAVASPFRPIGSDCVYWFFDDPNQVIEETLAPLSDGDYDKRGWQMGYLTIGNDGGGDLYVMDTSAPGLPVHCLSHESHQIEPDYRTFAGFVEDWIKAPEVIEANLAAKKAAERAEWRGRIRRTFLFVVYSMLVLLALIVLANGITLWLRR